MKGESIEEYGDLSNIAKILKLAYSSIKSYDELKLRNLSDQTIHSATIHQDSANIIIAVLLYSISKIFQRDSYKRLEGWDFFYNSLLSNWKIMLKAAEQNEYEKTIQLAGGIRNSLNKMDGNLGDYIKDIFSKAEINKASRLYEHGISMEHTAKLLGVSLWDLCSYIGQSNINEMQMVESMPEIDRIKMVEEFFE